MPPRRAARSVSRKSTPLSPPKASSISISPDASYGKPLPSRSSGRDVTAAQHQLQNIDEVSAAVDEESEPQQDDELTNRFSPSLEPSSQRSDLQSMLDQLDPVAIIDNITLLHDDSSDLLNLFGGLDDAALSTFMRKLSEPNSPHRKRFRIREKRFLTSREPYGELEFIKPNLVLHCLTANSAEGAPHGPWRPDPVLYLANLALQMIAVLSGNPEDEIDYLEYMFNNFPSPFADMDSFAIGDHMQEQTADITLQLLTQFYIHRAEADNARPEFDPDALLEQIFWVDDESQRVSTHLSAPENVAERIEAIRSHFRIDPQQSVDVDALKRQFSWPDFVVQLAKWTMARKQELDDLIRSNGGISTMSAMLAARAPEVISADRPELQAPSGPPTGSKLNSRYNRLKSLKAMHAAETSGADASLAMVAEIESIRETPQSPIPTQNVHNGPGDEAESSVQVPESSEVGLEDEGDPVLTQQTDLILETLRRQKEQSEKENKEVVAKKTSFLDRQEDAERVPWSEASEGDSPPRQPAKRQRSATEPSEDDDEYETDQRVVKMPRVSNMQGRRQPGIVRDRDLGRRPSTTEEVNREAEDDGDGQEASQATSTPQRGPPPRSNPALLASRLTEAGRPRHRMPRSTAPQPDTTQAGAQQPSTSRPALHTISPSRAPSSSPPNQQRPSTAPTRRVAPPAHADTPLDMEPPRSQFSRVNQEAKLATRLSREIHSSSQIQTRKPYTDAEIERLMEMVAMHGTKWALILQKDLGHPDGPLLQNRTQVQLKDKARNIKLDFLKYV
ncbi:hypothetical protein A1O3_02480 [Capronia epimyces CBS 606.96]|uniref:Myb-like domain-containing protein n=1 Tax=Capronia epimyces CBS 606.96 TaxID=1182542 RepID=W9YA95_9EURO|nr:uncharacterized protein A1O3_02480 [Capronia epimyces CBS 606.96]EXJ89413.1 hypothetical protein A1O3_02480 [Capronia epimyces CBS 606.96]